MEQATIQEVLEVKDHTNADALELVTILGWQVVVKKGEFNVGDKVVYVGLDSILPPEPDFNFKMQKPTSFKIISPKYALKHGE